MHHGGLMRVKTKLFAAITATLALVIANPGLAQPQKLPVLPADQPPGVDVWLDTDFFESLSKAQAFFNAVPGSYVTVVRVSNRNTLEVLYPRSPADQRPYVRTVEARTALPFRTDAGTGLGVIYAIASDKPFDYSTVADGSKWRSERLARPKGESVQEIAGYFFNEIIAGAERRFAMAQAAYINGAATYRVGDPGFPSVSAVIDAAGLTCAWNPAGTLERSCANARTDSTKQPKGVITGTLANPPPPVP